MIRTNSIHSISSQSSLSKDSSASYPQIHHQHQHQQIQQHPTNSSPTIPQQKDRDPISNQSQSQPQPQSQLQSQIESQSQSHISRPKNLRKLPKNFIDCPRDDLVVIISRMLTSLIQANDQSTSSTTNDFINHQNLTRFHSRSPPAISIYLYLTRLSHHSSLENSVLITSIYYIDLLTSNYPIFAINSLTVHRYLLTSTTVASKALCDSFCSNNYYAKVGGVNLMELNLLEIEFLNKVNWNVVPRINSPSPDQELAPRRKSSTILIDEPFDSTRVIPLPDPNVSNINYFKAEITPISAASDILDLYYKKMVMLIGGDKQIFTNHIKVGQNDDIVYYIEEDESSVVSDSYYSQDCDPLQTEPHQSQQQHHHQQHNTASVKPISSSRVMIQDDMFSTSSSSSYGSSYISDEYETQPMPQQQQQQQQQVQPIEQGEENANDVHEEGIQGLLNEHQGHDSESRSSQLQNSRKRSIINDSDNTYIKRINHNNSSTSTSL